MKGYVCREGGSWALQEPRKAGIRLRPTVGGWSGETTPRGAGGMCWAAAEAAAAAGREEEEEKQPQPGLGEEKAAQAGGGGWVPGRRLWKDKVQ